MHRFDEIGDVLAGLQRLMEREPALVAVLPRLPGTKEARYAHLLAGAVSAFAQDETERSKESLREDSPYEERIARLESTVAELRAEVAALRQKVDGLLS
jgi:uncharacterized protein YceH (UPF0502 family)